MNLALAKALISAVTDDVLDANNPNYPSDPGVKRKHMCSRFARTGTRKLYGPKYQGLFGSTAIETGENLRDAGFTATGAPQEGDHLVKMVGSGGAGHIGVYVGHVPGLGDGLVAENSSTALGRVSGAKGYRTLDQFGHYDLLGRLPLAEEPEQTSRLFLNDRFVAMMPVRAGRAYCKALSWAQALGLELGWDEEQALVTLDGRLMPISTSLFTREGRAFVWIGDLAHFSGLSILFDSAGAKVTVTRPASGSASST